MKIKHLTMAVIALAVSAMTTSCLNSDNDDDNYQYVPLTQAQKTTQMGRMAGTYQGELLSNYREFSNTILYRDTVKNITATLSASDSVLTLNDLPVKALTRKMDETMAGKIDMNSAPITLKAVLHPYLPYGYTNEQGYFFAISQGKDNKSDAFTLSIKDDNGEYAPHKTTIEYATRMGYNITPSGIYQLSNSAFGAQFILYKMAIEGVGTYDLNDLMQFVGKK